MAASARESCDHEPPNPSSSTTRSPGEILLTVRQVADRFKKDRKTIEKWINKGLPCNLYSGKKMIALSDLRDFPRYSRAAAVRALALDPDSADDMARYTEALIIANLQSARLLSEAQVENLKRISRLDPRPHDTAESAQSARPAKGAPPTPTRVPQVPDLVVGVTVSSPSQEAVDPKPTVGPEDPSPAPAEAAAEHDGSRAIDNYRARGLRPADLPDWFWRVPDCPPFEPPPDLFRYEVVSRRSSTPKHSPRTRFHVLTVRRLAGFESTGEPAGYRRTGDRELELEAALGDQGLAKRYTWIDEQNAAYDAAEREWRREWERRRGR